MVEDTKPGGQTDVALLWAHDQNIGAASPGVQPGDVLLSIGRCFDYSVCLVVRHNTAGRLRIVGQTLLGMAFDPCSGGAQIQLIKGSVKCWMCKICYNDSV